MNKHVSKKEQLEILLNKIRSKTNRTNVDSVLSLLEWTETKIDLVTAAYQKMLLIKQAKSEGKWVQGSIYVSRGEIWEAELGVNVGSEQSGSRPVLIIQNNEFGRKLPITIVAPLSKLENRNNSDGKFTKEELDKIKERLRKTEVFLPEDCVCKGEQPLKYPSIVLCQNLKEISKERLSFKIATLDEGYWNDINCAIKISLGIDS